MLVTKQEQSSEVGVARQIVVNIQWLDLSNETRDKVRDEIALKVFGITDLYNSPIDRSAEVTKWIVENLFPCDTWAPII